MNHYIRNAVSTEFRGRKDEDGITTMSIYDFLLKENSLEL